MDENGYLLVQGSTSHTNVEGVFACGDAAAIDAERWLETQGR